MGSNALGWPDISHATDPPLEEPSYVLWAHIGRESVFFYPPGSIEEHLVIEHGIDSTDVRSHAKGYHDHTGDHTGDHSKQTGARTGAVGDLVAVDHAHEEAA